MIDFPPYRHGVPVQIRFSDIDRLNHVNNACYLNYFELARVRYFNQVLEGLINWREKGFVLARTEINHILPVFLDDEIYCMTRLAATGNKSITIENALVRKGNNKLEECANGVGVLVAMDYLSASSMQLPEEWRQRFRLFEST